ncbi:unnamed protein product [Adineta steineri]|uniref:Uncharacterized protein n=1 Tax=Adineta steineri TaxID=433720 RepID=A0A815S1S0_9BILA|nr:unnamed protein product [Adineta steineri]
MESSTNEYKMLKFMKMLVPVVGVGIVLTTVVFALSIATLVKVNKGFNDFQGNTIETTNPTNPTTVPVITPATIIPITTATTTTTDQPLPNPTLPTSINITNIMDHLSAFQRIATANNRNRAVTTTGYNQTLDYITNTLAANTNFNVTKTFFPIRQFALASDPILISSINGVTKTYTFSKDLSVADFTYIELSTRANFMAFSNANPPVAGRVALVKRGVCAFSDKGVLAAQNNAAAILIYNDGVTLDRVQPMAINLGQENVLPALFLSFPVGQALADAAQDSSTNTGVQLVINLVDLPLSPVGNICADTPTGDATQTIVIGSHSDSVPAGPGINDNGSGSAANLGLAIALAKLFQTSTYPKYKYRVRFCWWGAEEIGLLGSDYHVKQAKNATDVGERLQDYLINLNYDMLGSPNYIFGIYDGQTANNDTPSHALPGSNKITALFRDWFIRQKLPWNHTDFSGRSDYGPFLFEGIVAGGLFTGADEVKDQQTRDYMDQMLGQGMGGIAGAIQDPCYHQACDSIQNINVFAYEKMVQAAAFMLENLARRDDLSGFLYPEGRPTRLSNQSSQLKYNSINEYFRLPYL